MLAHMSDRRAARTRAALLQAFGALMRQGRRSIRVADVVEEANVGRSTFYEHFSGADDLHMAALSRPFALLADAATGRADAERLAGLLDHFRENKHRARETLSGRTGEQAARLLAALIEERLPPALPPEEVRLAAAQLSGAALAAVGAWVRGETGLSSNAVAAAICRSSAAAVRVLAAG